jgi:hypothetical protein
MLVAKRDPFHAGVHDASFHQDAAPHAGGAAPRLARAMGALQIVGTLLAIPVGIGSAYSMYRANYSVESTCQSLRTNIVVMLDKSVDPSTRHMLVRRDVEAFERSCGAVDPDARAAFKALLAADKAPAPVSTASVRHAEPRPESLVRKVEPRADVTVKEPAAKDLPMKDLAAKQPVAHMAAIAAEAEPIKRDVAASDAVWLAAVRGALVSHAADPAPTADADAPTTPTHTPAPVRMPAREAHSLGEMPTQPMTIGPPTAAPALPPALSVAAVPAPRVDADHPVPPAPIPEMTPANATNADGPSRSRFGNLVAQIPIVGWAFNR